MPRKSRTRIVEKYEAREAEDRVDELKKLERELRRAWRRRRAAARDEAADERDRPGPIGDE